MQFYSIIRYNLLWLLPDKWVPIERNVLPTHPTILLSLSLSYLSHYSSRVILPFYLQHRWIIPFLYPWNVSEVKDRWS